jgi:hypothetical protein
VLSSYLYVWFEPARVSSDEAVAKLNRHFAGEIEAIEAHPRVGEFYASLIERFPALEDLDEDDPRSVWTMTPRPSDRLIAMRVVFQQVRVAFEAIRELAAQHGLVCCDEQGVVWPNVPGYRPALLMTSRTGMVALEPDRQHIERVVAHLTHRYSPHVPVVLEADDRTAQVCFGEHDPGQPASFAMAYRDSTEADQMTASTTDVEAAQAFMADFATRADGWPGNHTWTPVVPT